jgi:hypothetical protein
MKGGRGHTTRACGSIKIGHRNGGLRWILAMDGAGGLWGVSQILPLRLGLFVDSHGFEVGRGVLAVDQVVDKSCRCRTKYPAIVTIPDFEKKKIKIREALKFTRNN